MGGSRARAAAIAVATMVIGLCGQAGASSAPDAGRAFEVPAMPPALYGVKAPSADPDRQVRTVVAGDGVELVTETWLPAARGGAVPPERLPVIVQLTPYAATGADVGGVAAFAVPLGFAVTVAHVRGTGPSGGCIEQTAQHEVDDGARIIEDLGERAPWASGAVGMVGLSYPGGTQIATATGPDRERLRSLKALVVGAPVGDAYDFYHQDGVPSFLHAPGAAGSYFAYSSQPWDTPERLPERPGCQPPTFLAAAETSGDYTPWYAERDHIRHIDRLTTPTLMTHGHADRRVDSNQQAGLFDRIPATTPHAGLFGVWDHEFPHAFVFNGPLDSPRKDWERADFLPMAIAWYRRWLLGERNGAEHWPRAQVQGSDGQWRTASRWPSVPGVPGRLALGPGGTLGTATPTGSTTYVEVGGPELELEQIQHTPGTSATFTTPPLPDRLEIVGSAELDAWVTLTLPDSHVVAKLEALGPDGRRVLPEAWAVGARSARHLDPIVDGRFRQAAGRPAPVLTPFRMTVRFQPTSLVVPKGGRLELTVAGNGIVFDGLDGVQEGAGVIFQGPLWPSFATAPVTLHHSCARPTSLRFTMPEPGSQLLNVREYDETGPLADNPQAPPLPADGGGLATQRICPPPAGGLPGVG